MRSRGLWLTLSVSVAFAVALTPSVALAAGGSGGSSAVPASLRAHNTDGWWYRLMRISSAQKHLNGAGVTVAMLDGSIDTSAPELQGANISLRQQCQGGQTKSRPVTTSNADAVGGAHGTAMAADVVGQGHGSGPGGAGILGVAPRAHLLFYGMDPQRSCSGLGEATQIRDAVRAGADIITTSTSQPQDNMSVRDAIEWALKRDVLVVAAAGDRRGFAASPTVQFPAGYAGVVAVNAVDKKAHPWPRNPGPGYLSATKGHPRSDVFPVISAPGVKDSTLMWSGGRFLSTGWMSGTSPSTAIVAGCLALVKQKYPSATGNQLVQQLIHYTGQNGYGYTPKYGFGIIALHKMLAQDPTKWPDVNPLLNGPAAAYKNFPMSVYGKPYQAPKSAKAAASKAGSKTTAGSPSTSNPRSGSGSSVPVWVWVVVGVVVVAGGGLGGVFGLRRRGAPAN